MRTRKKQLIIYPHSVDSLLNHLFHLEFDVTHYAGSVDWSHLRLHEQVILQPTYKHTQPYYKRQYTSTVRFQ